MGCDGELHQHQHHPSHAFTEGGGDAEGSKCKDICHQDSAASRGTGTMTHPRATLRSTSGTSLEGTEGKQRSLFFPRVGDLVKGCREGGLCILYCVGRITSQRSKEAQSPLTSQGPFLGPWDGKFPAFPTVTHPLTDTSTSECFLCTYKENAANASKVIAQVTTSRAWGPRENPRDLPFHLTNGCCMMPVPWPALHCLPSLCWTQEQRWRCPSSTVCTGHALCWLVLGHTTEAHTIWRMQTYTYCCRSTCGSHM